MEEKEVEVLKKIIDDYCENLKERMKLEIEAINKEVKKK